MRNNEATPTTEKAWPRIRGLVAAPFTPMHADGSLNLDMIPQLAAALIRDGVVGAFVCGTTGEGMSLSLTERMAVAESWVRSAAGSLKIIVHVGHTCIGEAQALADHAQRVGADAIASMAPCFFHPTDARALADYCATIASAAHQKPFYYYHIPSMTNVNMLVSDFLRQAGGIPTLAGVKYTHYDLMDLSLCMRMEQGRYDILYGRDETLLAGLSVGVQGAVGSTYNFAAPIYHRLMRAYAEGDMETSRREQALAADIIATFGRYGGLPTQKAIMRMIGLDCGPVRLPLRDLSQTQYKEVYSCLEGMGFFAERAAHREG
jgi:N-acetylneuraminate lyase